MARALDTAGLPQIVATALWPWIDCIEMASAGMGGRVRTTAENAVALLRSQVLMTPPLETMLRDALHATDAFARDLDRVSFFQSEARMEALVALNGLIAWLQHAQPNGVTKLE
jgi:hypothetical protein